MIFAKAYLEVKLDCFLKYFCMMNFMRWLNLKKNSNQFGEKNRKCFCGHNNKRPMLTQEPDQDGGVGVEAETTMTSKL